MNSLTALKSQASWKIVIKNKVFYEAYISQYINNSMLF